MKNWRVSISNPTKCLTRFSFLIATGDLQVRPEWRRKINRGSFNLIWLISKYTLFYKQYFSLTQPQCCLTFLWIEPQMLLRCCLIHISSIILRHFLYLLGLGLFMSFLCGLFFIFVFIFIMINCIFSSIQKHLLFCLFFRI